MLVRFDEDALEVQPHDQHEWVLNTAQVAAGYGVAETTVRDHLAEHADELLLDKHFFYVLDTANGNTVSGFKPPTRRLFWTKRGVVRLGMFIRSPRAHQFRDFAEDLVLEKLPPLVPAMPTSRRELALMVLEAEDAREAAEQARIAAESVLETIAPKVEAFNRLMDFSAAMLIRDAAKILGVPPETVLRPWMKAHGLLMGNNEPYQVHVHAGRLIRRVYDHESSPGVFVPRVTTLVTTRGLEYIRQRIGQAKA
jgi:phage antirepressor YoqD-like protein